MSSSYDALPYDSQPFAESRPAVLAGLAALHGVAATDPYRARIVELGCASGGNLIPLAFNHPGCLCIGVDLSAGQVAFGQGLVERLGLNNCQLLQGDVTTLDLPVASADYVIAHGLYSWVPARIQSLILSRIRHLLAPGGLAYVSFNALPGWRRRGVLREFLLWHLREILDPAQRLEAALAVLAQLRGALEANHPFAVELAQAESMPPYYLAHEYLEDENHPVYLHEFMQQATDAGLSYLCDVSLLADEPGFCNSSVQALVPESATSEVKGQYLDFLLDRTFRQVVLVRDDEACTALDPDRLLDAHLLADLQFPGRVNLRRVKGESFVDSHGKQIRIEHPIAKAMVGLLAQAYPASLPVEDALELAVQQVRDSGAAALAEDIGGGLSEIYGLVARLEIDLLDRPVPHSASNSQRPAVGLLARAQAALGWSHTATVHHRGMRFDPFLRVLIQLLDGSRDPQQLTDELLAQTRPGALLESIATTPYDEITMRRSIERNLDRFLLLLTRNGIVRAA